MVEVVDKNIKQTFDAQTNIEWLDFQDKVLHHLEKASSEVRLVHRIGETGAMSYLAGESDWDIAMCRLRGKIRSARTRPVSLEIKNVVSTRSNNKACTHVDVERLQHESAHANGSKAHSAGKGKGKGKGKEKRCREDDVPPEPDPETKRQLEYLDDLKKHLECEVHSESGTTTYCWIDPSGSERGHVPLSYKDMTKWVKQIVSTARLSQNDDLPMYRKWGRRQSIVGQTQIYSTIHLRKSAGPCSKHLRST